MRTLDESACSRNLVILFETDRDPPHEVQGSEIARAGTKLTYWPTYLQTKKSWKNMRDNWNGSDPLKLHRLGWRFSAADHRVYRPLFLPAGASLRLDERARLAVGHGLLQAHVSSKREQAGLLLARGGALLRRRSLGGKPLDQGRQQCAARDPDPRTQDRNPFQA